MKLSGKLVALLLTAVMLLMLAGCEGKKFAAEAEQQTVIRMGYLEKSASEQQSLDHWAAAGEDPGDFRLEISRYPSVNAMLLDLNAGKLDWLNVPDCTANYMIAADDQLTKLPSSNAWEQYSMATRDADSALCKNLNDAIEALQSDGTMDQLVKTYLEDVSGAPAAQTPASINGAPVYKVGVTGDYPPFDYVSADGTPAGFNVALLTAISKKAGVNFEIVQVGAPARMTALASGKIDVVFWMGYTQSDGYRPSAEGLCLSNGYHREEVAFVTKKSAGDEQG